MVVRRLIGWSTKERPFSPKEYNRSHLKINTNMTYTNYLITFAKQYKNPKERHLLYEK